MGIEDSRAICLGDSVELRGLIVDFQIAHARRRGAQIEIEIAVVVVGERRELLFEGLARAP